MRGTVYPDGMKTCRSCGVPKPLTDFYAYRRTATSSLRPAPSCKPCSIASSTARWRANRAYFNERRNAKRRADPDARAAEYAADRIGKATRTAKSRAKAFGVVVEPVDFAIILARDGMICQICRLAVTADTLSFDHIIPLSKGGPHTQSNLQVAHRACNSKKGNLLPGESRRRRQVTSTVCCPQCGHCFTA